MFWYIFLYISFLLLSGIFFFCYGQELIDEDPILMKCSICLLLLNLCFFVQFFISIAIVYHSPHYDLKTEPAYGKAEHLLECARYRLPSLTAQWNKIDACINSVDIYNVSKGRVPYLRFIPTAFVFPRLDKSSVFVTPYYESMSTVDKALVLIHECAHIGVDAVDHAYRWQEKYNFLTEKQHYENADSFMDAVLYYCA